MDAIQKIPQDLNGKSLEYLKSLPEAVQGKVLELKNNQVSIMKMEEEYQRELCKLQAAFEEKFQNLYTVRKTIVTGVSEPADEECVQAEDEEERPSEDNTAKDKGSNVDTEGKVEVREGVSKTKSKKAPTVDAQNIPKFWLTALRHTKAFKPLIQEWDRPVLENLVDVRVAYPNEKGLDFVLEFHFKDNDYLNQKVLTKKYNLKCKLDDENPFDFDGPKIVSSEGCKISWKENKNVTVKTVKKTQKHKHKDQTNIVTKTLKQNSFFDFFEGGFPEDGLDDENVHEYEKKNDFNRGKFARDTFVFKAVLFFTWEIQDDKDHLSEEDYDPDFDPQKITVDQKESPNECHTQ